MQRMIDRLAPQRRVLDAGRCAGSRWAERSATLQQLRNLDRLARPDMIGGEEETDHYFYPDGSWQPFLELYLDMRDGPAEATYRDHAETTAARPEALAFWRRVLGRDAKRMHDGAFLRDFMHGAVSTYRQVKRRL